MSIAPEAQNQFSPSTPDAPSPGQRSTSVPSDNFNRVHNQSSPPPYQPLPPGRPWAVIVAAFILGAVISAAILWFVGSRETGRLEGALADCQQQRQSKQIVNLKSERKQLEQAMKAARERAAQYREGSIPKAMAEAALDEYGLVDALLLKYLTALESGSKVNLETKATRPDAELAAKLDKELADIKADIEKREQEVSKLGGLNRSAAEAGLTAEYVTLGIVKRNLLISKYGLSSPITPSAPKATAIDTSELDNLRRENARLLAENEALMNGASNLYASAKSDLEAGRLVDAEQKFNKIIDKFPTSQEVSMAQQGLIAIKTKHAELEAAKKPPIEIVSSNVKTGAGYRSDESQLRINYKNISPFVIKKVEFKVLSFDENGYPINSRRFGSGLDNVMTFYTEENIPQNKTENGMWSMSDKVRYVKIKLQRVDFYDAPSWEDADLMLWITKEEGRYILN
ncbi:DUF5780 domain-containing protein [Deltaproteobacteria bacterium OttesenSCG-928-K17]|nr:DUF5780 domain-containing protein [Deltaproteobacteria bacterium OttesenSCG-928-K17]